MTGYHRVKTRARRDENEPAIVSALESVGAYVCRINGSGLPDLLVGFRRRWVTMEVKVPGEQLRKSQEPFFRSCALLELPAHVVTNANEALAAIGLEVG